MGLKWKPSQSSSPSVLTLYRGDSTKIRKFDFTKTNKYCLVGQGIYLTNDETIAHAYREKDDRSSDNMSIFPIVIVFKGKDYLSYKTANQHELLKKEYVMNRYKVENGIYIHRSILAKDIPEKYWVTVGYEFDEKMRDGELTISREFLSVEYRIKLNSSEPKDLPGRVTRFLFMAQEIDEKTINLIEPRIDHCLRMAEAGLLYFCDRDVPISKEEFMQYAASHKFTSDRLPKGLFGVGGSQRLSRTSPWPFYSSVEVIHLGRIVKKERYDRPFFSSIIRRLRPLGFIGFEYEGGVMTSGKRHRAFSLWDDEYVNDHKIDTIR